MRLYKTKEEILQKTHWNKTPELYLLLKNKHKTAHTKDGPRHCNCTQMFFACSYLIDC